MVMPFLGALLVVVLALALQGGVLVAQTYDEATAFANEYAPEHLQLAIGEPEMKLVLSRVRNAGTVFLGETSSVAYGDYMTGANHVLPTGGLARSYSGLSTLDYLKKIPASESKIDQSFVRDLCSSRDDESIVAAILSLAHNLGLESVAEGVETEAQLELLTRYRCTCFQGYLFSKPLPAAEVPALLQVDSRMSDATA